MTTHLSPGELRAIAALLEQLDAAETTARDEATGDFAFAGDVPIHVGDTHLLAGWAEDADGEGHILRLTSGDGSAR